VIPTRLFSLRIRRRCSCQNLQPVLTVNNPTLASRMSRHLSAEDWHFLHPHQTSTRQQCPHRARSTQQFRRHHPHNRTGDEDTVSRQAHPMSSPQIAYDRIGPPSLLLLVPTKPAELPQQLPCIQRHSFLEAMRRADRFYVLEDSAEGTQGRTAPQLATAGKPIPLPRAPKEEMPLPQLAQADDGTAWQN
jgi:hypothetical protein